MSGLAVRRLTADDALARIADSTLLTWAAQGLRPGMEVWAGGSMTAVRAPDVAARNRLVLDGPDHDPDRAGDAALALAAALCEPDGRAFRPFGPPWLINHVGAQLREATVHPPFVWMQGDTAPDATGRVELADAADLGAVAALLDAAFPTSLARPGRPPDARWWVVRDRADIVACATDAWSAPAVPPTRGVGLIGGVATAARARGRGAGRAVVTHALAELIGQHGRAALMVHASNQPARALYESLGMRSRLVCAATVTAV